ncbi:MAG: NADH-ubiquinone oxidoreductase-F iron-sulfur binding region domain-containing protein [Patescibacteria group bacterium]|nr:NADH-ubiquinone oxidoreductase-F iron-sulfur binding region domain-containing protein [Patescibacteria group bacterium]
MNILDKIKKANLIGRGGGCFPTALKWEMVKKAKGDEKYVICNASEGESGVRKDGYLLENLGEKVINGITLAIDFLSVKNKCDVKGYIFINHKYYKEFGEKLNKIMASNKKYKIEFFVKPDGSGYIGGEETSLLNAMEGRRVEPRIHPPFPTISGLWNSPTLINNVETFYNVSLVQHHEFKKNRFYTISGDCLNSGVYELADNLTIEKILQVTENYPEFDFFIQVGGDASGEVLNSKQLNKPACGAGSITIYDAKKYKPEEMFKKWISFFVNESCGQCAPCREGVYRLNEMMNSDDLDWKLTEELLNNLDEASFCGLGSVVSIPIRSYQKNVMGL